MNEQEIIDIAVKVASQNTLDIIKWAVGIATPVVVTMATTIGVLWRRNNSKDKEIQRLNTLITQQAIEQIKKYYETLKELSLFVEKSVGIQDRAYELTESTLKFLSSLEAKYSSIGDNLQNLPHLLQEVRQEIIYILRSYNDNITALKIIESSKIKPHDPQP